MENATKALLIAAAVLIVILLIAFGMRIFNSTGDTSKEAELVGDQITDSTSDAYTSLILAMQGQVDEDTFYKNLKKEYSGKQTYEKVRELWNLLEKRNTGSPHDHDKTHISCYSGDIKDNGTKFEAYNLSRDKYYKVTFSSNYSISISIIN